MNPTPLPGLSQSEAAARLRADGANELPSSKRRGILSLARSVLSEPMILMLISSGRIYFLQGDGGEALLLTASVLFVIGISLHQNRKTERALEALRVISSPRVSVIRDGEKRRVAARELVRGDLILLTEGDRIPADGTLSDATNLSVDESLLTGESVPVWKRAEGNATAADTSGRDGARSAFERRRHPLESQAGGRRA